MEESFLKKYQPRKYKEYYNFCDTIKILKIILQVNKLNLLFVGNQGGGKTTFIKSTIREYYNSDTIPNNNILYINNLSDQGIQYYRTEVKTFCKTKTYIKGKRKIIILDDMDLISEQSQQVFRHYMDNYSHNVLFIASCTNKQKIIDCIQSRLSIFKLEPIKPSVLVKIFDKIKKNENLLIDDESKEFIIMTCNNVIRLLINIMEKIKLLEIPINIHIAKNLCTNISFYNLEKFIKYIKNGNLKQSIKIIYDLSDKGYSVLDILSNLFTFIKYTNSINENKKYEIIKLICKYTTFFYTVHEDNIELALFVNELNKKLKDI